MYSEKVQLKMFEFYSVVNFRFLSLGATAFGFFWCLLIKGKTKRPRPVSYLSKSHGIESKFGTGYLSQYLRYHCSFLLTDFVY